MYSARLENNLILGEKQRLFHLLQEADSLQKQLELQIYSEEDFDASKIEDIIAIKNMLFCNLLKTGLSYDYVSTGDLSHDSLRMTIENLVYSCPLKEAQKFLKHEFLKYCSDVPVVDVVSDASKTNTDIIYIPQDNNENIQLLESKIEELASQFKNLSETPKEDTTSADKAVIKELEKQIATLSKKIDVESNANRQQFLSLEEQNNDILQQQKSYQEQQLETSKMIDSLNESVKNVETKHEELEKAKEISVSKPVVTQEEIKTTSYVEKDATSRFEKAKGSHTFLFDELKVEVLDPYGNPSDELHVFVVPLSVAHNDNHVNVMTFVSNKFDEICAVSQKNSAVSVRIGEIDLLIRGIFANGDFNSFVLVSGEAAAMGYRLNIETTYHRPSSPCNYGHVCFEHDNGIFHIAPMAFQNNRKATAPILGCIEKNGERFVFFSKESQTIKINKQNLNYQMLAYWKDKALYCEVLSC